MGKFKYFSNKNKHKKRTVEISEKRIIGTVNKHNIYGSYALNNTINYNIFSNEKKHNIKLLNENLHLNNQLWYIPEYNNLKVLK